MFLALRSTPRFTYFFICPVASWAKYRKHKKEGTSTYVWSRLMVKTAITTAVTAVEPLLYVQSSVTYIPDKKQVHDLLID